eukprot:175854_1
MACACPCFGDEADAEEKPNQMIQLDGLGMLRLDTQHVGQGSQGARSAKWFYFGETDNRLAVVNMLLCITCVMLWICLAVAINMASRSGATTTDIKGNKQSNGNLAEQSAVLNLNRLVTKLYPDVVNKYTDAHTAFVRLIQLDGEKNAEGIQTTDTAEKFKRLQEKYTKDLLNAKNMNQRLITQKTGLEGQLKTVKQKFTTSTAVLENLKGEHKAEIDVAQKKYAKAKPFYDQLVSQFKLKARRQYDVIPKAELEDFMDKTESVGDAIYADWLKSEDLKKKQTESKSDDDVNKDANYDKNNENEVNTNGVEYQNLSNTEPGTNVDKQ